jgi:mannose/fructose/N-acetylgalactosamine-specific phosphotransferase system component IIC
VGEADFLGAISAAGLSIETSVSGSMLAEQMTMDAITDAMVIAVPLAMLLVPLAWVARIISGLHNGAQRLIA